MRKAKDRTPFNAAYLKYARIYTMLAKNLWDLTINYNSTHLLGNIRSHRIAMVTERYRPNKEIEKGENDAMILPRKIRATTIVMRIVVECRRIPAVRL